MRRNTQPYTLMKNREDSPIHGAPGVLEMVPLRMLSFGGFS